MKNKLPLHIVCTKPDARIACDDTSSFNVGDTLYHPENKEFARYIVKACNSHDKLISIANLAAGMIMSINSPVTAKVGDKVSVPELQARLLRRIEVVLDEVAE